MTHPTLPIEIHPAGTAASLIGAANSIGTEMQKKVDKLEREIKYLRHYSNRDCIAMAEVAMAEGTLDSK